MGLRRLSLAVLVGAAVIALPGAARFEVTPAAAGEGRVEAPQAFVAGFEDLPLMPGLSQIPDAGVVFDTPSGRIVEAYAEGPVDRDEVAGFYARALPQLGWEPAGAARYRREGEVLELDISGAEGASAGAPVAGATVTVRFYLSPD